MGVLTNMPLRELGKMISKGELSSKELVQAFIDRIGEVGGVLNALVQFDGDKALSQAGMADDELSKGRWKGPLHGIPFTVKDSIATVGIPTACGVEQRKNVRPRSDATAVTRLRQAGGILLGKTNLPMLCSVFETDSGLYGRTNNPYGIDLTPGGSSGGEAALIAAGGTPLGLGSDRGGSIRIPCHYCGIAGIKPSNGLVPSTGHFPPSLGPYTGQIGPMAKYVDDLILTLPIISGEDFMDPSALPLALGDPAKVDMKGLRVAYFTHNTGMYASTAETVGVVEDVTRYLSGVGVSVMGDSPDCMSRTRSVLENISRVRTKEYILDIMKEYFEEVDLDPSEMPRYAGLWLERARNLAYEEPMTSAEYYFILNDYEAYKSQMLGFMRGYDALVCPVAGKPAMPHGFTKGEEGHAYNNTWAFSLTGWPAVTVRAGTSSEGLPIGIQVVARYGRDDVALAIAKAIEGEFGGYEPPEMG